MLENLYLIASDIACAAIGERLYETLIMEYSCGYWRGEKTSSPPCQRRESLGSRSTEYTLQSLLIIYCIRSYHQTFWSIKDLIYYFFIFIILPHRLNYNKQNKKCNKQVNNIKLKLVYSWEGVTVVGKSLKSQQAYEELEISPHINVTACPLNKIHLEVAYQPTPFHQMEQVGQQLILLSKW